MIPLSSQPVRKPENRRPVLFPRGIRAALAFARSLLALAIATGPVTAQQFTFHHYGQDEGLRNLDVFGLEEDNTGLLWLATENGLFRYDGGSFHLYRSHQLGHERSACFERCHPDRCGKWLC